MKFKKGDNVVVTQGKDRGRKSKIERISLKKGLVFLPGLNKVKKHVKKKDEKSPGGIIEISKPLSVSKIALICPKCSQPTRIGFVIKGKEKLRICKKCNLPI